MCCFYANRDRCPAEVLEAPLLAVASFSSSTGPGSQQEGRQVQFSDVLLSHSTWMWYLGTLLSHAPGTRCSARVCEPGAWSWCLGLILRHGVWTWCSGRMHGLGAQPRYVTMVLDCSAQSGCVNVVLHHGLWAWYSDMVCRLGAQPGCVNMVLSCSAQT